MKKGFTLIELLAVIVILAIIAVIAVPIVLNIINDTKESAVLRSADFYLEGVETSIATSVLNNIQVPDGKHFIMEDGNICIGTLSNNTCTGDILNIEMDGEMPSEGTITIKGGEIKKVDLILSDKEIWTEPFTGKIEYKLAPGVYDKDDKLLMSWDELVTKYDFENLVENGGADIYEGSWPLGFAEEVISSIPNASKLVLDDSVTSISEEAFAYSMYFGSNGLKSIIIPDSVTSIGYYAFFESVLEEIIISDSVSLIGEEAFVKNHLATIIVDPNNPIYDSRDNSNAIIETVSNTLMVGSSNTVVPNTVTSIAAGAFWGHSPSIITIPNSVTSIGEWAFAESELTEITILSNEVNIGDDAFYGCYSLTTMTILSNEVNIADSAFDGCDSLTTIYYKGDITGATWIPDGVTVVSDF